jgi:hypothetical protein
MAQVPRNITEIRIKFLKSILWKNDVCFALNDFDIGYTDIVEHMIDTSTHAPIRESLPGQPVAYQQAVGNCIR